MRACVSSSPEIAPLAEGAVARGYAKPHGDLTRVVKAQLFRAGLDEGGFKAVEVRGCGFRRIIGGGKPFEQ